jgi:hypothetical protein
LLVTGRLLAEPAGLRLGLYLPNHLGSAEERLLYVAELARLLSAQLGRPVVGKAYARFSDLRSARPDLAVLDGQCALALPGASALAAIEQGGTIVQQWALFSRIAQPFSALRGARLAYVATGCRDAELLQGMLWGEVPLTYFAARVERPTINAALSTVRDYGAADLVFAPLDKGKSSGLHQVFATAELPNPVLLQLGSALNETTRQQVVAALRSAPVRADLGQWRATGSGQLQQFARIFQPPTRTPIFALPRPEPLEILPALRLPAIRPGTEVALDRMVVPP